MKKALYFVLLICVIAVSLPAEVKFTFTEFGKPTTFAMDKDNIYIGEKTNVFIFNRKDGKLIKKFGKAGSGPGEFQEFLSFGILRINADTENLLISTIDKLSFFTKSGDFIKEHKIPLRTGGTKIFLPLKNGYVCTENEINNDTRQIDMVVAVYDKDLKKVKNLTRTKLNQVGGKTEILSTSAQITTFGDSIYFTETKNLLLDVYNATGTKLRSYTMKTKPIPFTQKDEDKIWEYFKNHPLMKNAIDQLKANMAFPKEYPAIRSIHADSKWLYVASYQEEKKKNAVHIFDIKGPFKKTCWVTMDNENLMEPIPFVFENGKFYQLVENVDDETWELHVQDLGI